MLRLMRGKLVTKNSGATASYISGLAQVIVMIDEPRSFKSEERLVSFNQANQVGRRDQHSFCHGPRILQAPAFRKGKCRTEQPYPKDEP